MSIQHRILVFSLLGLGLLWAPAGCAEGIIMNPTQTFPEAEIVLPTPEPTPEASPSTPLEKVRVQVVDISQKAKPYQGWVLPILLGLFVLWAFWQLMRWIYELTTSTPRSS